MRSTFMVDRLPSSVRSAWENLTEDQQAQAEDAVNKIAGTGPIEVVGTMWFAQQTMGPTGARFFLDDFDPTWRKTNVMKHEGATLDCQMFLVKEIGVMFSSQDVSRWDAPPGCGTIMLTIGCKQYLCAPLAAMPAHAGPLQNRRVLLPVSPHLVILPQRTFSVEINWPDAPPLSPMAYLDGYLFRPIC